MTTTMTRTTGSGRVRSAWKSAHEPVESVPGWARIAAYTVTFLVLPSSIWRILAFTFHVPLVDAHSPGADINGDLPDGFPLEVYVVLLSLGSELLAFTAVGLVARWGEVFPRWLPVLRGHRVPIAVAVVPAAIGSLVLTLLWSWATVTSIFGKTMQWDVGSVRRDRLAVLRRGGRVRAARCVGSATGGPDRRLLPETSVLKLGSSVRCWWCAGASPTTWHRTPRRRSAPHVQSSGVGPMVDAVMWSRQHRRRMSGQRNPAGAAKMAK